MARGCACRGPSASGVNRRPLVSRMASPTGIGQPQADERVDAGAARTGVPGAGFDRSGTRLGSRQTLPQFVSVLANISTDAITLSALNFQRAMCTAVAHRGAERDPAVGGVLQTDGDAPDM